MRRSPLEAKLVADTGFGDALKHLRSVADGNGHTKGKLFERLIRSFLKTDQIYVDKFEEVWLWDDYPGRNGRTDFGIDLVARGGGVHSAPYNANSTTVRP